MSGSDFFIHELDVFGGVPPAQVGKHDYETFRWSVANRSIPKKPWDFGVEQRTSRTDYPGSGITTEQVLGANFTDFTLSGTWDDRYNMDERAVKEQANLVDARDSGKQIYDDLGGWAVKEWQRFEDMVMRGNPVRISFEDIVIEGIIVELNISYETKARISYEFVVSPHHRKPGGFFTSRRSPRSALNARQLHSELDEEINELTAIDAAAPTADLVSTIYVDAEEYIEGLATLASEILVAIEQRNLSPEVEPHASLLRLSSQFYSASTIASNLILLLDGYDSSEALAYESGENVLNFEYWARGLMYRCRRIVIAARRAAADTRQRALPSAIALYTPNAGESLYGISNRFYKTPHLWRRIAERNQLQSFTLSGAELLIIPEVTTR